MMAPTVITTNPAVANAETVTTKSGYPLITERNYDAHHMRELIWKI